MKERMQKLLTAGGMMDYETVEILGYKLDVLRPPAYRKVKSGFGSEEKEKLLVVYNYFEDDWWEWASYDPVNGTLRSNKVGGSFFAKIVYAAYILLEFYSDTFMISHQDGEIVYKGITVGWLNYLFGESYTHERTSDFVRIHRLLPEHRRDTEFKLKINICASVKAGLTYIGFTSYQKCFEHVGDVNGNSSPNESWKFFTWIAAMYYALTDIKSAVGSSDEEKLAYLKELIKADGTCSEYRQPSNQHSLFAQAASMLPLAVTSKVIADIFGLNVWDLLDEMAPLMETHIPLFFKDIPDRPKILDAVPTEEYLGIPDEDRLFYWTPDGDVRISDETEAWFAELRAEYDEILSGEEQLIAPKEFLGALLSLMKRLQTDYCRVYFFKDLFDEFAVSGTSRNVQAAAIQLQRLTDRYAGEIEELQNTSWPCEWRTPGRLTIKRYVALLANNELRLRVLGF